MLYLKEMDETMYAKLCGVRHVQFSMGIGWRLDQAYFSTMSDLHKTQMTAILAGYLTLIKKGQDDDLDAGTEKPVSWYSHADP